MSSIKYTCICIHSERIYAKISIVKNIRWFLKLSFIFPLLPKFLINTQPIFKIHKHKTNILKRMKYLGGFCPVQWMKERKLIFIGHLPYLRSFKKHFITLFHLININQWSRYYPICKKVIGGSDRLLCVPQLDLRPACFSNPCFDSTKRIKPLK